MKNQFIIGMDGGGTKTHAIITDQSVEILAEHIAGPSNFQIIGVEKAAETIYALIEMCCNSVNCSSKQISAVVCGLTGAGRIADQERMAKGLKKFALSKKTRIQKIIIESDARIALEGAFKGLSGIIVIAGTGSIAFGKDSKGNVHRVGGWGRILGDEGSGYFLGRHGLSAVTRQLDGRGEKTQLTKILNDKFGLKDQTTIISAVYKNSFDIAPTNFSLDDHNGSMVTWKDFGKWYYDLSQGRQRLSPEVKKEIQTLVANSKSFSDSIKILYQYLQTKTRYISVQLGIGGWQPFDAQYVHDRGYGDCKALANYMMTLLSTIGVQSYPVLIHGGEDHIPMIVQFPSNQFNHVILCIPTPKDSLWLECTSQSMPFGQLGYFTENKHGLLIASTGGTVVHTPVSSSNENMQIQQSSFEINFLGTANINLTTTVTGNQRLYFESALVDKSAKEKQEWLLDRISVPNIELQSYQISGLEEKKNIIVTNMSCLLHRYATTNGNRIFFYPNAFSRNTTVLPDIEKRISPIKLLYPYIDIDSIIFRLPQGYVIEAIPKQLELQTLFAKYSTTFLSIQDSVIIYTRRMEFPQSEIPAALYQEYRSFITNIVKNDRSQIVLRKK